MIVYYTSTSNAQAVEFAKLALHHRLYVSSWQLNGSLHDIIDCTKVIHHRDPMVSLAYCTRTEKYVGVCIKVKPGFIPIMQVFVRLKKRGQGIGKELVQLLGGVGPGVLVGPGVVGAGEFWDKCRVPEEQEEPVYQVQVA